MIRPFKAFRAMFDAGLICQVPDERKTRRKKETFYSLKKTAFTQFHPLVQHNKVNIKVNSYTFYQVSSDKSWRRPLRLKFLFPSSPSLKTESIFPTLKSNARMHPRSLSCPAPPPTHLHTLYTSPASLPHFSSAIHACLTSSPPSISEPRSAPSLLPEIFLIPAGLGLFGKDVVPSHSLPRDRGPPPFKFGKYPRLLTKRQGVK